MAGRAGNFCAAGDRHRNWGIGRLKDWKIASRKTIPYPQSLHSLFPQSFNLPIFQFSNLIMQKPPFLLLLAACAFINACGSYFLDFCFEEGSIFEAWLPWL